MKQASITNFKRSIIQRGEKNMLTDLKVVKVQQTTLKQGQ